MTDQPHPLTTGQIESTLAHVEHLDTLIELCEDSPEGRERQSVLMAQINDAFEALGSAIPDKAERTLYVLAAAEAVDARLKLAQEQIQARRKRVQRTVERCRGDILPRLLSAHREMLSDPSAKLQTIAGTVYTSVSPGRLIAPSSPEEWPDEWKVSQPDRLDRSTALREIKSNPERAPEGFSVERTTTTRIRK